ncbi:MAG: helix-turn-helix domain-containing protein [Candidatus Methanomethylicia archaeon]
MSLKRKIIELLAQVGEATCNDISNALNVDINTIKSYMYLLYKQKIVERKRVGKKYVYRLASPSPLRPSDPPPSSSSTSKVKTSFNVKSKNENCMDDMKDNMKSNITSGLYNEKVKTSHTFNFESFNVKTTDAKVKNISIFNLDSCLYEIEKLKQEINELRSYILTFNVNNKSTFNVKEEEEEGGGSSPLGPPLAGVGREWAYTVLALLSTKRLAQHILPQNSDPLLVAILEKLLTHYIITSNKFVVFNDYRELIEYFNLNVNDIIKSRQTLAKSISKLVSLGLIYFIKISGILKLGLKKKALKMILEYGGINENKERQLKNDSRKDSRTMHR